MDIKQVSPTQSSGASMIQQQALLAAIITSPDDDTPRSMYADFLQEQHITYSKCPNCNGEPVRHTTDILNSSTYLKGYVYDPWDQKHTCKTCKGSGEIANDLNRKLGEYIKLSLELHTHKKLMQPRKDDKLKEIQYNNDMRYVHPNSYNWYQRGMELREQINHLWNQVLYISFFSTVTLHDKKPRIDFEVERGFISSITCTANQFLEVCDKLIWHESMVADCYQCVGSGDIIDRDGHVTNWTTHRCETCDGRSKVARPCSLTAHPVSEIEITDLGRVYDNEKINTWEHDLAPKYGIEFTVV